ncbi:MAG: hypothetical protein EU536_03400 [Promethearchaeota archaeon]|nr:MAG: hypothetical protein EU536_03400 [Candidatus Lokiarchaeota archaeon]
MQKALELARDSGSFLLIDLIEKCKKSVSIASPELIGAIDSLCLLEIFIPEFTMEPDERAKLELQMQEIEQRIAREDEDRLNEQINEAKIAALEVMKEGKYVDAAIYYEVAAEASKALGRTEDYELFVKKAEESLMLKLTILEKLEKEKKPKEKEKKEGLKMEPAVEDLSDEALTEKLNKIISNLSIPYISIIDAAQELNISVERVQELARKAGWRTTKARIYK